MCVCVCLRVSTCVCVRVPDPSKGGPAALLLQEAANRAHMHMREGGKGTPATSAAGSNSPAETPKVESEGWVPPGSQENK